MDPGARSRSRYSTTWLKQKQKRLSQESSEDKARQRALEAESEWIASSPKARQAKSKARIQRYEELVAKQNDKAPTTAQIIIPVAERLGNNVIDFDHIAKAFGDRLLIDDLSFKLPPGGIVGVIGPNGAGKTTLFRMITGQEKPDKGVKLEKAYSLVMLINQETHYMPTKQFGKRYLRAMKSFISENVR